MNISNDNNIQNQKTLRQFFYFTAKRQCSQITFLLVIPYTRSMFKIQETAKL